MQASTEPLKSKFFGKEKRRVLATFSPETLRVYEAAKQAAVYSLQKLGKGHSERTYESVIQNFLYDRKIPTKRQARYFTTVDNNIIETGILDIEVNHSVLLELKVGHDAITPEHKTQLRRYLKSARQKHPTLDIIGAVFLFTKNGTLKIFKILDMGQS